MLTAFFTGVWHFFDDPGDPLLLLATGVIPGLHHWQQIYSFGLDKLATNASIDGIQSEGWRFVAGKPHGDAIAAVVSLDKGKWEVTSVTSGPGVQEVLEAASKMEATIEALPEVAGVDYEVHVLIIPGLATEGFVVKMLPNGPYRFVPYQTQIPELKLNTSYSPIEFLVTILKPLAEERLRFARQEQIL